MFKWLKDMVLKWFKKSLLKQIDKLSNYEDELEEKIGELADAELIANEVVSFTQVQLVNMVKKASGWFKRLLGGDLVKKAEEYLIKMVSSLDAYKDDIKSIVNKVDEDKIAAEVIKFVQEILREIVEKNIYSKNLSNDKDK